MTWPSFFRRAPAEPFASRSKKQVPCHPSLRCGPRRTGGLQGDHPGQKNRYRGCDYQSPIYDRRLHMAKIGAFSKTEHGYKGRVRTLTVNTEVEIVSIDPSGDGAPQYRLYSAGSEVGAGW